MRSGSRSPTGSGRGSVATRTALGVATAVAVLGGSLLVVAGLDGGRPAPSDDARAEPGGGASGGRATPSAPPDTSASPGCGAGAASRRLTVVTFNIHGALDDGLHLRRTAREIAAMDADVVMLQEVDRWRRRSHLVDEAHWLGRRLGMHAVYGANTPHPHVAGTPGRGSIGNAILSRHPVLSHDNVHLPRIPEVEVRGILRAELDVAGTPVAVYTTHLEHRVAGVRQRQGAAALDVVRGEPLPHLLGGDLNAGAGSPVLRKATRRLSDVWTAVGSGEGRTVRRARIDYVLHSEEIEPVSARVVPSSVSDHHALRTEVRVPAGRGCGRRRPAEESRQPSP